MGRKSQAGTELPERFLEDVAIPGITDGDHADVVVTTDLAFAGPGRPIAAQFVGAPLANLGILGAWVSNTTTGAVTVRFCALSANVTGADLGGLHIEALK
jgi:hypothetical protein